MACPKANWHEQKSAAAASSAAASPWRGMAAGSKKDGHGAQQRARGNDQKAARCVRNSQFLEWKTPYWTSLLAVFSRPRVESACQDGDNAALTGKMAGPPPPFAAAASCVLFVPFRFLSPAAFTSWLHSSIFMCRLACTPPAPHLSLTGGGETSHCASPLPALSHAHVLALPAALRDPAPVFFHIVQRAQGASA